MGQERVKGETATKVEIVLGVLFVLGALSSLGKAICTALKLFSVR